MTGGWRRAWCFLSIFHVQEKHVSVEVKPQPDSKQKASLFVSEIVTRQRSGDSNTTAAADTASVYKLCAGGSGTSFNRPPLIQSERAPRHPWPPRTNGRSRALL